MNVRTIGEPVTRAALHRAEHLLFGGALLRVERFRRRATGASADFDGDAEFFRVIAHCEEIRFVETAEILKLGKMHQLCAELRAVIERFERRPLLAADAEEVDAEAEV